MSTMEERIAILESQAQKHEELIAQVQALTAVLQNGIVGKIERLEKAVDGLTLILEGDERLDVPPLRLEVKELSKELTKVNTWIDRVKWVGGALGLTNVGVIGTWVSTLLGKP